MRFEIGISKCSQNSFNGLSKMTEDRQIQCISSEEMISAVKEACNPEQQRLITFVYETGCRIGEAINLSYHDVKDDYVILYT